MRRKLRTCRGESMIESLISMVIIAITGMMLAAAVASVLRAYHRADTMDGFDLTGSTSATGYEVRVIWEAKRFNNTTTLGTVTAHQKDGLCYYDTWTLSQ